MPGAIPLAGVRRALKERREWIRQMLSLCPLAALIRGALYTMVGLDLGKHEPKQIILCRMSCYRAGVSNTNFPHIQRMSCSVPNLSDHYGSGKVLFNTVLSIQIVGNSQDKVYRLEVIKTGFK